MRTPLACGDLSGPRDGLLNDDHFAATTIRTPHLQAPGHMGGVGSGPDRPHLQIPPRLQKPLISNPRAQVFRSGWPERSNRDHWTTRTQILWRPAAGSESGSGAPRPLSPRAPARERPAGSPAFAAVSPFTLSGSSAGGLWKEPELLHTIKTCETSQRRLENKHHGRLKLRPQRWVSLNRPQAGHFDSTGDMISERGPTLYR